MNTLVLSRYDVENFHGIDDFKYIIISLISENQFLKDNEGNERC